MLALQIPSRNGYFATSHSSFNEEGGITEPYLVKRIRFREASLVKRSSRVRQSPPANSEIRQREVRADGRKTRAYS